MSIRATGMPITAFSSTRNMGGFIVELAGLAAFKQHLPFRSRLIFLYDTPMKATLTELCPHVDRGFNLSSQNVSLNMLSRKALKALSRKNGVDPEAIEALKAGMDSTWLVVTPNMRTSAYYNLPPARFRIPEGRADALRARFLAAGGDPDRFIVTFHCREGGYKDDAVNARNVDPHRYFEVMRHVVERQGGQAVRLGDPSMTAMPAMKGLVDLSREPDNLLLSAFALSQSRYAVCTNSSNLHLAAAFRTPLFASDAITAAVFPPYPEHLVLTKVFITPEGREIRQQAAYDAGLMSLEAPPEGYRMRDCSVEELIAGVDRMLAMTLGVDGWREPKPEKLNTPRDDVFRLMMRKMQFWAGMNFA
jgi:putative glycosyltransferase (TIGR04372 family)